MSDKKKLLIPVFVVLALVTFFILYSPSNLLPRAMDSVEVASIGLHLADGGNTIFLVGFSVENPSSVPVTVSVDSVELLVNGTYYSTVVLGSGSVVVESGETQSIIRLVQLTGSPVGYQPDGTRVHYVLDISAEVTGEVRSLGLEAQRTVTVSRVMSWWYDRL